jgi:hypothetical protein
MTQQHLIVPPPELLEQWIGEIWHEGTPVQVAQSDLHLATRAAQWGADQELEACRHWLEVNGAPRKFIDGLLAFRRPKPPSLKEINLKHLDVMQRDGHYLPEILQDLRRAVEQLND